MFFYVWDAEKPTLPPGKSQSRKNICALGAAFDAKTTYVLRPENFCALKSVTRKVWTFWISAGVVMQEE